MAEVLALNNELDAADAESLTHEKHADEDASSLQELVNVILQKFIGIQGHESSPISQKNWVNLNMFKQNLPKKILFL